MLAPDASRPHMPGYGVLGPDEGTGLLPWSWAEERLVAAHDYWVASTRPDGSPHVMPVWGVWLDDAVWFSSSLGSRKARNLLADDRCSVTTDNPQEPVVVEGRAQRVTDESRLAALVAAMNEKYNVGMEVSFLDPESNASFRIEPRLVFGLDESDFVGSPTRWRFGS